MLIAKNRMPRLMTAAAPGISAPRGNRRMKPTPARVAVSNAIKLMPAAKRPARLAANEAARITNTTVVISPAAKVAVPRRSQFNDPSTQVRLVVWQSPPKQWALEIGPMETLSMAHQWPPSTEIAANDALIRPRKTNRKRRGVDTAAILKARECGGKPPM